MEKPKFQIKQIRFQPELLEWIKSQAAQDNRSAHAQIIHYLEEAKERTEEKKRVTVEKTNHF